MIALDLALITATGLLWAAPDIMLLAAKRKLPSQKASRRLRSCLLSCLIAQYLKDASLGIPTLVDHEFGGMSTDLKLSVLEKYLSAYTTALKGKFKELWYIDAFAGTGFRTIKYEASDGGMMGDDTPARVEQRRGSAMIAIDTIPAFDRIIFIEKKPSHCAALEQLMREHSARDITLDRNDANASIRKNVA